MQKPIANKIAKLGKPTGKLYNLPVNTAIFFGEQIRPYPIRGKDYIEMEAQQAMRQTVQLYTQKSWRSHPRYSLFAKAGAILMLFVLSVVVVACGANANTTAVNLNGPVVTVTINMNNNHVSPTPTLSPMWCGAWASQSTFSFNDGDTKVTVYGKFVQNDKGNPIGVDGATATATVYWPGGATASYTSTTTHDGLATFEIPTDNQDNAINKVTLVLVSFSKEGVGNCAVAQDRAAFFTLVNPKNNDKDKNNDKNNDDNNDNNDNNNDNNDD
jgi:hypothetical protein